MMCLRAAMSAFVIPAVFSFVIPGAMLTGCGPGPESKPKEAAMPARDIETVLAERAEEIMALPHVVAVGQGATEDGTPCIKVYVLEGAEAPELPESIEGHPVVVQRSGEIRSLDE